MAVDAATSGDVFRAYVEHVLVSTLRAGDIVVLDKPSEPDEEQQHIYTQLGIDWKRAYPARKTEVTP